MKLKFGYMKNKLCLAIIMVAIFELRAQPNKVTSTSAASIQFSDTKSVTYQAIRSDNLDIFYREAGNTLAPTILSLLGFPSASHMYRDILKDLSAKYHVIAPDYP